jgi:acyl-CoA reductase-like NAD-dependent aldehyde dehydrogenase
MTDKEVNTSTKSHTTFKEWKKTSFADRANLIHKVTKVMRDKKQL